MACEQYDRMKQDKRTIDENALRCNAGSDEARSWQVQSAELSNMIKFHLAECPACKECLPD